VECFEYRCAQLGVIGRYDVKAVQLMIFNGQVLHKLRQPNHIYYSDPRIEAYKKLQRQPFVQPNLLKYSCNRAL
jgi:hypothetical protein